MNRLFALAPVALVALAGCVTTDDNAQYAQRECKIAPLEPGIVGRPKPANTLARRQAEMDLATSSYRMRNLQRPGYNLVEEALRDCY
jgi:hypothetical protein